MDQLTKALESLVEFVKTASPVLWQAANEKVQADLLAAQVLLYIFVPIVLLSIAAIIYGMKQRYDGDGYVILGSIVGGISMIVVSVNVYSVILLSKAPTFYAIKEIAGLVVPGK